MANNFDDLIPKADTSSKESFHDLIPTEAPSSALHTAAKGADYVTAGISGGVQGAMDATGDMASLAGNIYQMGLSRIGLDKVSKAVGIAQDYLSVKGNQFKNIINSGGAEARAEHPITAAVGAGTGYVAASSLLGNTIAKPINSAIAPVLSKYAPPMLSGPVGKGVATQGVLGGIMGAGANPDQPLKGMLYGAGSGMVMGGIGGYVSKPITRANEIIDSVGGTAKAANINPSSPEVLGKIKTELNNKGINLTKEQIRSTAQTHVQSEIAKIAPEHAITQSPAQTVVNLASSNYKINKPINDANYAVLNSAPGTAPPTVVNSAIKDLKTSIPPLGLPTNLPKQASIGNLITYKRSLEGLKTAAYTQVKQGNLPIEKAQVYSKLLNATNQDIEQLATTQGLQDHLAKADSFYRQNIAPLKVFNKSGNASDPAEISNAFRVVNTQLNSKNPDLLKLGQITQSLGSEGKRTVGYAVIQNMFNRSTNAQGMFDPAKFNTAASKYTSSGLSEKILTPEHQEVLSGIQKVMQNTNKIIQQSAPQVPIGMVGWVQHKVQDLVHSEAGIGLLRLLGGSDPKQQATQEIMKNLINGTISIGYSKYKTQQPNQ